MDRYADLEYNKKKEAIYHEKKLVEKKAWYIRFIREVFKDSNGDGIGDIPGIIEKLNYLKELGVNVLWISPMLESPAG